MENVVIEIMGSPSSHKEQVELITGKAEGDEQVLSQLFDVLLQGTDVQKGTAAEVMKFVSKDHPEMILPYIDTLIEYIDYKAPRVRWGCPEAIGNLAPKYPDAAALAIPKLLANLGDKSTVVRWCAAFALTEIAKYNQGKQPELVILIQGFLKTEQNNGVRNVYLNALKYIDKKSS
jgi:hypothetical protein